MVLYHFLKSFNAVFRPNAINVRFLVFVLNAEKLYMTLFYEVIDVFIIHSPYKVFFNGLKFDLKCFQSTFMSSISHISSVVSSNHHQHFVLFKNFLNSRILRFVFIDYSNVHFEMGI